MWRIRSYKFSGYCIANYDAHDNFLSNNMVFNDWILFKGEKYIAFIYVELYSTVTSGSKTLFVHLSSCNMSVFQWGAHVCVILT